MNIDRCPMCRWRAKLTTDPCCGTCQQRAQMALPLPPVPMRRAATQVRQLTMRLEARMMDS